MSEINPSIWQQNEKGEWKLYFNNDSELNTSPINNNNEKTKIIILQIIIIYY